jgi:hypothetical protein
MNLDKDGLPIQADGDAKDQLHRIGMILIGYMVTRKPIAPPQNMLKMFYALTGILQPSPGVFIRHKGSTPDDVSCDQLIGALCGLISIGARASAKAMFLQMIRRFGFAQNIVDGLNGDSTTKKIPDFMLFRAMPLFCRFSSWAYPFAIIFDAYLLALVIGDYIYLHTDKDPADVNNTLMTVAVCSAIMPTPFSALAKWLWPKLCPGIYQRLERYHRAEALGNPEIAELWKPIVERIEPVKRS